MNSSNSSNSTANPFGTMFSSLFGAMANNPFSNPTGNPFAAGSGAGSGFAPNTASFMNALNNNPFAAMMNTMMNTMTGSNGAANGDPAQAAQQMFGLYDTWRTMYNSWASAMGKMSNPLQNMVSGFQNPLASDAFSNMTNMASTYFRLFEFWQPMMKSMQSMMPDMVNAMNAANAANPAGGTWNEEAFSKAFASTFDPEQYNRIMNAMFNFVSPDVLENFSKQVTQMMEVLGTNAQNSSTDINDMMQKSMEAMQHLASGNMDEATRTYVEMISTAQKPLTPLAKMVFIGKDRTTLELTNELLKQFMVFTAQYNKLNGKVREAGQSALQNLTRQLAEQAASGSQPKTYDDFFKMWVKSNEKAFDALFNTEEYGYLQGEMQTTSMLIRKHSDMLMELAVSDFPVATRSELDEAYESIHDLKRRVRSLERALETATGTRAKDTTKAPAAAPKAAAKATSTPAPKTVATTKSTKTAPKVAAKAAPKKK
jgi:polyhydroxyalkanoate synthase subunit PhaE